MLMKATVREQGIEQTARGLVTIWVSAVKIKDKGGLKEYIMKCPLRLV